LSDLALAQSLAAIVGRRRLAHCCILRGAYGISKGHAFVEFVDEIAADVARGACDMGDLILVDGQGRRCAVKASRATQLTTQPLWTIDAEDLMTISVPSGELRMIL
jgi:hypothetical protein